MEKDIVLAYEIVSARCFIGIPPLMPDLRRAAVMGPFNARSIIANHRIEPHVNALIVIPLDGNRYPPIDVA